MSAVRNISFFLLALVLSKPLGFIQSFVLAKALGPADYGVWMTLILVISYSPIACLGTVETLVKRVPYFRGRDEPLQIKKVENSVMGSLILSALFIVVLAVVVLTILPSTLWGIDSYLVVIMLVTAATMFFSAFSYHRFAAYENFKMVGSIDFFRSVVALLFIGGLGWKWGLKGAVVGYFLHEATVCGMATTLNIRALGRVGVTFERDVLADVVRVGFPITLLWWTLTLTGSVDRVVLGSLLGPLAVGHYGLGLSLVTVLALIPMVVGRVLYPQVNKLHGKNEGAESMKRIVLAPTLTLGTLLANLQLVLLVIMPFLYTKLLPRYQPGLLAGQILVLGSYFGSLLRNGANYLIAINRERVFLKYIVVTLLFNIVGDVGLVKAGFGISGVAVGTSLAGLLLTTMVWRKVLLGLKYSQPQVWTTLLTLYLPNIVLGGAASLLYFVRPSAFQNFDGLTLGLGFGLFVVLNGILVCFPVYREEMQAGIKMVIKAKESSGLFSKRA